MQQSFLIEPGKIRFEQTDPPVPREHEVLIRMQMVGICGSDLNMFKNGHRTDGPLTIGHEGVGRIEAVGKEIPAERVGERVVIEPNIPCGHCPECYRGRGNICRNKRIVGVNETGCFAEYLALPGDFAHPLPASISDADAVTIEPAAVALAALNRSDSRPGDTIAVIGLGTIGMLIAHVALSMGYRVLVSEPISSKVEKATAMGAERIEAPGPGDASEMFMEKAFQEAEVAVVYECAGTADSATLAVECAPRGAEVVLLGLTYDESRFKSYSLSRKGNVILPSLIYDHPADFRRCIRLVSKGLITPGIVVSGHYSLEELQLALEEARKAEAGKIVVNIST
jgi:threonine dehydrogenase-like Zn-dependent dehydrogenase